MELFVFPIGQSVFYPSIAKPLNVFEPKYVQMIHDSLAQGIPIAIGHVDEPDREYTYEFGKPLSFVRPIVGYGMPLILEQRMDGSFGVFLQGIGKARLKETIDKGTPYIICKAEPVPENRIIDTERSLRFVTINKVLTQWVDQHISDAKHRESFLKNIQSPDEVIGCYASYIVSDSDMKQLILESDDINEKIDLLTGLISSGELVS